MGKLTKAQKAALDWFAERDGAYLFGKGTPPMAVVKWLASMGLLARETMNGSCFTFFHISDAGREKLKGSGS